MSKELEKAIEEGKRLFLLYGEEQFILEKSVEKIIRRFLREEEMDFNLEIVDVIPKDIVDLINRCDTLPFMAEYRVVVFKNLSLFEHRDKTILDRISEAIKKLPDSTVLVIKERNIDKRKALYKAFQKNGVVEEQNYLTEEQMISYLGKWFYQYGLRIKKETISLLIHRAGADLTFLLKECEKLASYAKDIVTDEMVVALVREQLESKIFDLTDALGKKDRKKALEQYRVLLDNREPVNMILAMIVRQFKQIYEAKVLMMNRASKLEMEQSLKVHSFVVGKIIEQAKQFSAQELQQYLRELLKLEWDFKRGKANLETGLEIVMISATQKQK